MRITGIDARTVHLPGPPVALHRLLPVAPRQLSFLRVRTDEGIDGAASTWLPGPTHELVDAVEQVVRPLALGRSVLDRAAMWAELQQLAYFLPLRVAASAFDLALWDAAARHADLPVHRLLGTRHDRLATYASVSPTTGLEHAVAVARDCQARGFRGVKLHSEGRADDDIATCEAVRAAVGADLALILDPVNGYDRRSARRVVDAVAPCDLAWLEAPLPDDDVQGYVELRARSSIPIANGEVRLRGLLDVGDLARRGAVDIVRYAADVQGGLTGFAKVSAVCEAHGLGLEGRAYGSTLVQAAHLHGAFSAPGSTWYEVPDPIGWLGFGMADQLDVGADGYVEPPTSPGMGVTPDWDAIEDATVAAC